MAEEIKECNWSKEKIIELAENVANVANFDPIQQSDFAEVIRVFGGSVEEHPFSFFTDSIEVNAKFDFKIKLDPSATKERQRFTMAHELGHYFLHSKQGQIKITAFRRGTNLAEQEANYFAANILMPKKLFTTHYKSLSRKSQQEKENELAKLFHVSVPAIRVRCAYLGLGI